LAENVPESLAFSSPVYAGKMRLGYRLALEKGREQPVIRRSPKKV
jgi:hypothetical protein